MQKEALYAARIGSIPRFTGEPAASFVRKYSDLLSQYMDLNILIGILDKHSGYEDMNAKVNWALHLAGAEADSEEGIKSSRKNLASVFSRISLTDEQKKRGEFYRYPFREFSTAHAFPCKTVSEDSCASLLAGFYKAMDQLQAHAPERAEEFYICFDRLTKQFMWCIAASDYEGEDISLYDYMKMSEAIMACLVQNSSKKTPYTIVAGNFLGIQKYIFSIASANSKGVAKRLRARSFYVDIVSRVFAQYVIDQFQVNRANILLETGGKFYIVVPTSENIDQKCQSIKDEFEKYLFQMTHGTVSFNMAWTVCNDEGIIRYSDTVVLVNKLLDQKKASPFANVLKTEKGWNTKAFVLCDSLKGKHKCGSCETELISENQKICSMCSLQLKIGSKLPKARYIVHTKQPQKNAIPIFKEYSVCLEEKNAPSFDHAYLIEVLNSTEIKEEMIAKPLIRKYMTNHIPMDNNEPKVFDSIAKESNGMDKLAVLKADVDILGFLFAQGLRTQKRHFGTISRVNTMSRMLEVFFSGYIEELLEQKKYQNVYSVFSGGDDLFLIGPWDIMLALAVEIRNNFRRFCAENDSVTISAAVSIFHSKEHISFMAERSEENLKRAKNQSSLIVYPHRTGRNAICVMNQLFSWGDFEEQLHIAERLSGMIRKNLVDISMLRRIVKYSKMYKEYLNGDVWQLRFEPLFTYDEARNYHMKRNDKDSEWFAKEYIRTMKNASDPKKVKKNLFFAESTITIALNKTRRERR